MAEEGYIKFNCNWIKSKPIPPEELREINEWREKLYSLGLIKAYEHDKTLGVGNLSVRLGGSEQFIITGHATGTLVSLNEEHYTKITDFDLETNSLTCQGPIKASLESLTHAVIYQAEPKAGAIIHIHNLDLWEKLINKVPTTSRNAGAGTLEMAKEIIRLFKETDVKDKKILVMAGHEEGIITFGKDLKEAGVILLSYFPNKY